MERDNSLQGIDGFDKLAIERVREQDVEDLDEDGWRIVSQEKRVVEISTLGEGAGGAVTKCKLKGGKTMFALKIITSNPDPDVRRQILRELKFNKKWRCSCARRRARIGLWPCAPSGW
jgi:mitogen-activated protein kinase kinase